MISFPIVFGSITGGLTLIAYYGSVLMTLAEGSFKKKIDCLHAFIPLQMWVMFFVNKYRDIG